MPKIIVIGAGLSGLAVAFRIQQRLPHAEIHILEERNRPGGNIHTSHAEGYTIEHGPNGIFDQKPHMLRLCRDLGLGEQLIVASEASRKNRYLFLNNELQRLPGDPLGLLKTRTLSLQGKFNLLMEPFRRRKGNLPDDESVAEFARRRFGREAADVFINALVTGVHAGDPERLSARAAFPRMLMFEQQAGSVVRGAMRAGKLRKKEMLARGEEPKPQQMWSFRSGLQVLIDALAERFGNSLHLNTPVKRIEKQGERWHIVGEGTSTWDADFVINTAPAFRQAEQLEAMDSVLADELAAIRFNKIAVVVMGYKQEHAPKQPPGFGYIAPENTKRDVLGVQWCSSIFPDRAPNGYVLWRALCGGVKRADVALLPDDELTRKVHTEMIAAMGVLAPPSFTQIVRWPQAIPQYEVGHLTRIARIDTQLLQHRGLFLGGNSYRGVAMNDCCEQAEIIAERLQ